MLPHYEFIKLLLTRLLTLFLLAVLWTGTSSSAASFEEHQIKAAILYNFADFVTWPDFETVGESPTVNYCVLSEGDVEQGLQALVGSRQNNSIERRFSTLDSTDLTDLSDCHLLYLGDSSRNFLHETIPSAALEKILTVSDQSGFIGEGGMIELVRQGSRIQVHINLDSVTTKGFRISSKLMNLAITHSAAEGA